MKLLLGILLFSMTSKAFSYTACKETFNPHCNQQSVKTAVENIQENLKNNTDIIFMELVRQKVLSGYDLYEKNMNTILKCWDLDPIPDKCLPLLNHYIGHTMDQNTEMRILLAMWNPKGKPHEFNDRDEDKYRKKIKHLSFVDGIELEPLIKEEEEIARNLFNDRKESFFESEEIKENPNSFVEILKFSDGIKDLKMINMNWGKENYLNSVIKNPALKYISKAQPTEDDIIEAFRRYRDELKEKRARVENLSYIDLKDFLYFDDLVNGVLTENPFFCPNAFRKKESIDFSRKAKEWIFSLGGLILCPFTSGYTCAAGLFAGSAVNAIDRIGELNTTMEYSITPGTATAENVMDQSSNAGISMGMMALSLPLGGISKIGIESLKTKSFKQALKSYSRQIKKVGLKRIIIKKERNELSLRYGFKELSSNLSLWKKLGSSAQFYTLGVSKLTTKKLYTFKPFEFLVTKAEKKLLTQEFLEKGGASALPRTVAQAGDTILESMPYLYGLNLIVDNFEENLDQRTQNLINQRFLDYEIDPRFDRLRELEKACLKSPLCKEEVDFLIPFKKRTLLLADFHFHKFMQTLRSDNSNKDKSTSDILFSNYMNEYGSVMFYNFYEIFPNGPAIKYISYEENINIEELTNKDSNAEIIIKMNGEFYKITKEDLVKNKKNFPKKITVIKEKIDNGYLEIQKKILDWEILRNNISNELKIHSVKDFKNNISENEDVNLFLEKTNAKEILNSGKSEREIQKTLGKLLNAWVRASEEAAYEKYQVNSSN